MRWLLVLVVLATVASLAVPAVASAETASATAKLSQSVISVGDPAFARVNVHQRFSSVEQVCFNFTFVNDLFDPGEALTLTPQSTNGFGAVNIGDTPRAEQQLCFVSFHPEVLALFLDGKDKNLEIGMRNGSVEISSLVVTVTGTAA